jgi:hypothetical protein
MRVVILLHKRATQHRREDLSSVTHTLIGMLAWNPGAREADRPNVSNKHGLSVQTKMPRMYHMPGS